MVSGKEAVAGGNETSARVILSRWSGEEGTLGMCGSERRLSLLVWEVLDI
jgi:hypothetical protein